MLRRPATAREPAHLESGRVSVLRGPLVLAFVLGCAVSAIASGRFSVRLILDGAVSFAFVPAIEMAAFAVVYRIGPSPPLGTGIRPLPFARAADLFFRGNAPWLLWLAGLAALAGLVAPRDVGHWVPPVLVSGVIPIGWSAYIDYHFFRQEMHRPARRAAGDLVLHRAIGWIAATAYFLGRAIWAETLPELARWMGL